MNTHSASWTMMGKGEVTVHGKGALLWMSELLFPRAEDSVGKFLHLTESQVLSSGNANEKGNDHTADPQFAASETHDQM